MSSARGLTVVGAGGIGGVVGAHLAAAGHDVTFIEANRDHAEAIRTHGLRATGHADLLVRPAVVLPDEIAGPLQVVLLAVKSRDTEAAMAAIESHLEPDGYVASLQNGLEEYKIARHIGEDRTVGAFLTFGGNYAAPGEVVYGGPGSFKVGELDGVATPRVRDLARTLTECFHPVEVTDNIFGYLWGKSALGAFYFATALVDEDVPRILDRHEYRTLFGRLVVEVAAVATAEGVRCAVIDDFDPNAFVEGGDAQASWQAQYRYWAAHVQQRTGVWRDLAIHHRPTEVDHILGAVVERARRHRVPVPLLVQLHAQVKEAEVGVRSLDWSNLNELERAARRIPRERRTMPGTSPG